MKRESIAARLPAHGQALDVIGRACLASVLALSLAGCTYPPRRNTTPSAQEVAYITVQEPSRPTPLPAPTPRVMPAPKGDYTVQRGDTLWSIAQRFRLADWHALLDANPGLNPKALKPGKGIFIPKGRSRETTFAGPPQPLYSDKPLPTPRVPRGAKESRWIWPVRGAVLCRFGRANPEAPDTKCRGVILAVRPGATVRAAKSGLAFAMASLPGLGRTVAIDHGDGTVTMYAHNNRILIGHGQYVQQGDAIAQAGSTGRAARPQLLFRIDRNRKPVDPLRHLP